MGWTREFPPLPVAPLTCIWCLATFPILQPQARRHDVELTQLDGLDMMIPGEGSGMSWEGQTRTHLRGGRGRSRLESSETRGEEEGGGRSGLVSSEMWHVANEDSLARGEEEGGGRSGLVSLEMQHVTNKDSLIGGRKEGGEGR